LKHGSTLAEAKQKYFYHKKEYRKWKKIIDTFVEPTKEQVLIDKLTPVNEPFILCTNDEAVLISYKEWQDGRK